MKLIYLEWADAISNSNWMDTSQLEHWSKNSDWFIRCCGWLVEETPQYVIIALQWKPEDEWTQEQFVNVHKIPKTWIRKRRTIKI